MKKLFVAILFSSVQVFAAGKKLNFSEADGKVSFTATGKPAMIKILGEGPGPQGTLDYQEGKLNGTLSVDINKLTTKIDLRDDHMKNKYLEVEKYPTAEIIFKNYAIALDSTDEKDFEADFKLHGVTKKVSGKIYLSKDKKLTAGVANFKIKVTDYLDTLPSYAGIKVADEVEVKVDLKTNSQ